MWKRSKKLQKSVNQLLATVAYNFLNYNFFPSAYQHNLLLFLLALNNKLMRAIPFDRLNYDCNNHLASNLTRALVHSH